MQVAPKLPSLVGESLGNYTVRQELGTGGMGTVYLAEHEALGKKAAIKVLHPKYVRNPEIAERFLTEARSANEIDHPNIVAIYDYEVATWNGGPLAYFVMDYVDGESLSAILLRDGPLASGRALAICRQVADALHASHKRGIIHRDLKLDNLMIVRRDDGLDTVKVLDFGVARLDEKPPGSLETQIGTILGTPEYMAPEQWDGTIDHRADIYSLGVVLYRLLTGQLPFQGKGFGELYNQHKALLPPRPSTLQPSLSPHVDVLAMKALAKNPDDRFSTMEAFADALSDPIGHAECQRGLAPWMAALQDAWRASPPVLMALRAGADGLNSDAHGTVSLTPQRLLAAPSVMSSQLTAPMSVASAEDPPDEAPAPESSASLPRLSNDRARRLLWFAAAALAALMVTVTAVGVHDITSEQGDTPVSEPAVPEAPAVTAEAPAVTAEAPAVTAEAPAVTAEVPKVVETPAAPVLVPLVEPEISAANSEATERPSRMKRKKVKKRQRKPQQTPESVPAEPVAESEKIQPAQPISDDSEPKALDAPARDTDDLITPF